MNFKVIGLTRLGIGRAWSESPNLPKWQMDAVLIQQSHLVHPLCTDTLNSILILRMKRGVEKYKEKEKKKCVVDIITLCFMF